MATIWEILQKRIWKNGLPGNTPVEEVRLNGLEQDVIQSLVQLARNPESLFAGSVEPDGNGAPISAVVEWPDGVPGVFSGSPSPDFPGALDGWTVTRVGAPTVTFTQPTVTRNGSGHITSRPPMTIS
jgi:hypothetical protein